MEPHDADYRATVARALAGRSVAGSATAHGLPRDAIRRVLQGHDPRLSRADEICRALGITFTLGSPRDRPQASKRAAVSRISDSVPAGGQRSPAALRADTMPVRDLRLAELLVRIADHWEALGASERERLAAGLAAILDLSGASGGRG